MRTLDRKILRDAVHLKGQLLATAVLVACGVAVFIMLRSMHGYLNGSLDRYYADYGFGDAFAHTTRAPLLLESRIAALAGVDAVKARIVQDVILDVPGLAEPATGRLVSIPDGGQPRLDRLQSARVGFPIRSAATRWWSARRSRPRTGCASAMCWAPC